MARIPRKAPVKRSPIRRIKVEAVNHLTANLSYPLMVIMSVLLMPAMICRFYQGWFQMLLIDFPLFTASSFSSGTESRRQTAPFPLVFHGALGLSLTRSG